MIQIIAIGLDVNIINFVGEDECSKVPPALFNEDGSMRATRTESSLVKALKEETKIESVPHAPQVDRKRAVIVDAIYSIRHWSFGKDETF